MLVYECFNKFVTVILKFLTVLLEYTFKSKLTDIWHSIVSCDAILMYITIVVQQKIKAILLTIGAKYCNNYFFMKSWMMQLFHYS